MFGVRVVPAQRDAENGKCVAVRPLSLNSVIQPCPPLLDLVALVPVQQLGWEDATQPPLPPAQPWRDGSKGAGCLVLGAAGLGAWGCSAQQCSGLGMQKDKSSLWCCCLEEPCNGLCSG